MEGHGEIILCRKEGEMRWEWGYERETIGKIRGGRVGGIVRAGEISQL